MSRAAGVLVQAFFLLALCLGLAFVASQVAGMSA